MPESDAAVWEVIWARMLPSPVRDWLAKLNWSDCAGNICAGGGPKVRKVELEVS